MINLIIHIGTHKTGTTSIQKFLLTNESKLLKDGILFPKEGRMDNSNHAPLAWELNSQLKIQKQNMLRNKWESLFNEIENNQCDKVVLSSEEFSLLGTSSIELLQERLTKKHIQCQIIIFLRTQYELLQSNYVELLKQGVIDINFASFITQSYFQIDSRFTLLQFDYQYMLQPWIKVFEKKNIQVINYSKYLDAVKLFCDHIGINITNNKYIISSTRSNVSPNINVVIVLIYANCYLSLCNELSKKRRIQITYELYEKAVSYYENKNSLPFNGYTEQLLNFVKNYYMSSNQWLKDEFAISFDETFEKYNNEIVYPLISFDELEYWHSFLRQKIKYSYDLVT